MHVWGVSADNIERIVYTVSEGHYDFNVKFKRFPEQVGRAVRFTLTVSKAANKGGRIGHTGRRIAAACWHVHRDIMVAIMTIFPDARIKTAQADYRGIEDFMDKFASTGYTNIGSQIEPMYFNNACECSGSTVAMV